MYNVSKLITVFFILAISACSDEAPVNLLNSSQVEFCKVISHFRDAYASEEKKDFYIDQEITLQNIYDQRIEYLKSVLKGGAVENWEGTISNIVVLKGKGAFLEVELSCEAYLEPQDGLIIGIDTLLYQDLRRYSENSKIMFSGHFITPLNQESLGKYPHQNYYGEKSFSKTGSMREPEFLFKFTAFHD